MDCNDLEFYSTQELIDELMRRATFQGVVVHARDEAKTRSWTGERTFSVRFNSNLEHQEACRLLDAVSGYMASLE